MRKIVTILGARPQFVKAAVLSRIIATYEEIEEVIIHTGQHFDKNMSDVFFEEMKIPKPKYNLAVNNMSHGAMTGKMLLEIERVLLDEKPDAVIVYGDTNSTLAGALAAKKLHLKVVHIEAGLRSFNMKMPEEINRVLTDKISDLLSCPTDIAIKNLEREGIDNSKVQIEKHGDIMKDAVAYYQQLSSDKSSIINDLNLIGEKFVLATIHRQENTDDVDKLKSIFESLEKVHETHKVVLPLHPRTQKVLEENNMTTNIVLTEPVGYYSMLELLKNCTMVITDSGGLQKEAFFNKKHCIIVRDETEWIELVDKGYAKIVGSNSSSILDAFTSFKNSNKDFSEELYGNNVGEKIYQSILKLIQ